MQRFIVDDKALIVFAWVKHSIDRMSSSAPTSSVDSITTNFKKDLEFVCCLANPEDTEDEQVQNNDNTNNHPIDASQKPNFIPHKRKKCWVCPTCSSYNGIILFYFIFFFVVCLMCVFVRLSMNNE